MVLVNVTLERPKKAAAPICALCRLPQARWNPDALEHLCARCESDRIVMMTLVRPKKPNAVC